MRAELKHIEALTFETTMRGHKAVLDTSPPLGMDKGPSPKESLLSAVLGCSAMDVVSLLKKHKVPFDSFEMSADAQQTETQPRVFRQIDVIYKMTGPNVDRVRLVEAVELSMTKYCGVSAMVSAVSPIFYTVVLNGEIEARGQAKF